MRTFLILLIIGSANFFSAQNLLSPTNVKLDSKYIQDESSEVSWIMENAGSKIEIGKVITDFKKLNKKDLLIKTTVKMKQSPEAWIDSTIVKISNFQPVYHSSFNSMRNMSISFNKNKAIGYYLDKKTQKKDMINEATTLPYFDSNSYPALIRFLPLTENYTAEISIFDYNPTAKKGVIKAYIEKVEKSEYNGRKVWVVKTTDDIQERKAESTYYIDMITRKVIKQEINAGGRKMIME
ncbi:DUF3108 domain-containing protein [Epilithonimonas arachidiradicis]|uniref:Outer membrane lipoprotein-sorting protein n=2 Tax=Epilithonimonas arachidiradicis TaxID=1617282 RepID=A0A420DC51_9FLAO|nr:hypothetical protein [Epilithonimonas arachidiradicis]RKE89024.1 hypothetical protein BXY58_1158 [Epilithonimonas arachidiradicis]